MQTPVGARCKQCAQARTLPTYQADALTVLKAASVGLIVATLAFIFTFAFARGFALWLSPLVGLAVGEVISLGCNRKRAGALQAAAVAAIVAGALFGDVIHLYLRVGRMTPGLAAQVLVADGLMLAIIVVLATVLAITRLR